MGKVTFPAPRFTRNFEIPGARNPFDGFRDASMNLDVHIQMAASSLFRSLFNKLSPKRQEGVSQSEPAPVPAHLIPSGKPVLRIVRNSDHHSTRPDH